MSDFRVHILGCGSALPTTRHYPSAQVVAYREKLFLIDCGEGAQRQWRALRLDFGRLVAVFISHLHGDHCYGLPGLLSTLSLLGRRRALPIYGPRGIADYLAPFISSSTSWLGYEIEVHTLDDRQAGPVYEDRSLTVSSLPLDHRMPCTGYLFRERGLERHIDRASCDFYGVPISIFKALREGADYTTPEGQLIPNARLTRPAKAGRSYAYCSDTAYRPALIPLLQGVDLLYHEATFPRERAARAAETGHSTAEQAAQIARASGVGRLLIGHYSARYSDATPLLEEARTLFPETTAADELMTLEV